MRVILLATDEAAKISSLSDMIAAPMLPVVNRPVMATTVEILARSNYKHILISLSNRGGNIAGYFGSGRRWGVLFEYVMQREPLGSAGALKWAARFLDETFLVIPGDVVLDLDIEAALAFHQAHGGPVTAVLHRAIAPGRKLACIDEAGLLHSSISNEAPGEHYALTGAYIFEPQVLSAIPARTSFDIVSDLLPALAAQHMPLQGYVTEGYWNPLDSLSAFEEAQQVFLTSAYVPAAGSKHEPPALQKVRFPSIDGRQIAPGIWVGRNHVIHPSVRVAAPVYIGENCWIGQNVELGAGSVIGSNVVIDDDATVHASSVLSDTYVGKLVNINHRIVSRTMIIDPATGERTQVVDPFLLGAVREINDTNLRFQRGIASLVAGTLLLLFLPLLLLSALLALLSTGRILDRLPRVGRRAADTSGSLTIPFTLLRFATARRNGSVRGAGAWLRRMEFDRLPELFNVLRGDLALVGVMPLSPADSERLNEEWHQKRFECPVGITGLWYLQTDASSDLEEILVADAYYVATRSQMENLFILLRTPLIWLRRRMKQPEHAGINRDLIRVDG